MKSAFLDDLSAAITDALDLKEGLKDEIKVLVASKIETLARGHGLVQADELNNLYAKIDELEERIKNLEAKQAK